MDNPELTPISTMITCPKCGFQQPSDQYCAQCGIDLVKLRKNPATMFANALGKPVVLAMIAVVALVLTVQGVRSIRNTPKPEVASESQSLERRGRTAQRSRERSENEVARRDENTPSESVASIDTTENNLSSTSAQITDPDPTTMPAAAPVTAAKPAAPPTDPKAAVAASEMQVTFAWAEASREWLQMMGATTPGFHRVPELDTKLRESVGGYRILEVTRRKLGDKVMTTNLVHGDRLSVRFESTAASEAGLTGSIQPAMRGADGSIRSPAAAAVSIDKGQGSIVTLGASTAPIAAPGAPPANGAEIVLLILPRWGGGRNP